MSQVVRLLSAHIEHFKSFKGIIDVDFPMAGGFYFLGGRNEIEPRLGANGAGKSSLWDAIFWCLYGTSIKGDKASDLVSWGHRRPMVDVVLEIDGVTATIQRMGCPDKLGMFCDDPAPMPVTQAELDSFLGLTKARFAQAVLFGQGAKLFLDLLVTERGALLEEILDLSIWERLAKQAGDQAKRYELEQADAARDLAFLSGKLEGLTDSDTIKAREATWFAEQEAALARICDEAEAAQEHLNQLEAELKEVPPPTCPANLFTDIQSAQDDLDALQQALGELASTIRQAEELSDFYLWHTDCPTCAQALAPVFVYQQKQALNAQLTVACNEEQETKKAIAACRAILDELESKRRDYQASAKTYAQAGEHQNRRIEDQRRALKRLLAEAQRITDGMALSPFAQELADLAVTRADLEAQIAEQRERELGVAASFRHMDYWRQGFKKVKLFVIKNTLEVLELETAAAASALGLAGWQIKFVTETETKSGTLKAGVQIMVSSPAAGGAWSIWSGGESQRIRLAIALGLSNMIQRMAGVDYQFEVWDEPSNWLSPEGIADLMECLSHRASVTGKTLWVIDHRAFDTVAFDGVWIVSKTDKGSDVEIME